MKFTKGIPKVPIPSTCKRSFLSIAEGGHGGSGGQESGQNWYPHPWQTTLTHQFEGWAGKGPTMIQEQPWVPDLITQVLWGKSLALSEPHCSSAINQTASNKSVFEPVFCEL